MQIEEVLVRARMRTTRLPVPAARRELRVQAGLRQADLAEVIGVTPACIARYENGTREPKGDRRQRYATLLRHLASLEEAAS
jgi:transcriptional regulator with XRE-family HTH domain